MTTPAVLLCGAWALEQTSVADALPAGTPVAVVDELCHRPDDAARALKALEATRVVLGLCGARPPTELVGALRRAGAESFGIEPVLLEGRPLAEAQVLLTAALAKLRMLARGEHGKRGGPAGVMSRRALFSPLTVLSEQPVALLDTEACLGSSDCGLCIERCPANAISRARRKAPKIDESACTACGRCVTGCPTNALRLSGCSTAQIEAQLEQLVGQLAGVMFVCPSATAAPPPGWALIELPTLAIITPGWILQLRARGMQVNLARCDQQCCAGTEEIEAFADLIATAGNSLENPIRTPPSLAEPAATVEAVLAMPEREEAITLEHSAAPLGMLELDSDRCTVCGACALACPTNALRFDNKAGQATLQHDPRACVGCDRCTTVCPEHATSVRRGIDLTRLRVSTVEIAKSSRERCSACGIDLPPAPMRRRLRELLPEIADTPVELCTGCAMRAATRRGSDRANTLPAHPSATEPIDSSRARTNSRTGV